MKARMGAKQRLPWGHTSRHCTKCGKVGPRVSVFGGWAHRYCIDGKQSPTERMRQKRLRLTRGARG